METPESRKGIDYQAPDFPFASMQKYVIVAARFNSFVVDPMIEGALQALDAAGVHDERIYVCRVPGAYELPLGVLKVIERLRPSGVIALGAVIRGGTPHFDYVCGECARGISDVSMRTGIPVAFGVLTTDNEGQAIERAALDQGNKGGESALAVLEMVEMINALPVSG